MRRIKNMRWNRLWRMWRVAFIICEIVMSETSELNESLVLWEYKFRIYLENWKRMIQCDFPPYDLDTIEWTRALCFDMDNIYSYAQDMYRDARRMLDEKTPLL